MYGWNTKVNVSFLPDFGSTPSRPSELEKSPKTYYSEKITQGPLALNSYVKGRAFIFFIGFEWSFTHQLDSYGPHPPKNHR